MAAIVADDIFKCIFYRKKPTDLRFKFHWNLFPGVQMTISQHWFRQWLGAEQATSHCLSQCRPSSLTHICGTRGRCVYCICHGFSTTTVDQKKYKWYECSCDVHIDSLVLDCSISVANALVLPQPCTKPWYGSGHEGVAVLSFYSKIR